MQVCDHTKALATLCPGKFHRIYSIPGYVDQNQSGSCRKSNLSFGHVARSLVNILSDLN
jgi:hypothetical protein